MAIEEFVLTPTRGNQLAFQGRIVAQAEGPAYEPKLHGRYHTVTVYEAINRQVHVQIVFQTNAPGEQSVTLIEDRLRFDDIESVLSAYNPTENLGEHLSDQLGAEPARLFKKALWYQFDRLTLEIQRQMNGFDTQEPALEKANAGERTTSRWSSWLPFGSH